MRAFGGFLLATSFVLILPACGPGDGSVGEALPSAATNTTNEVGADMAVGHAKKPRARKWASSKKDAAAKKDGARKWDAAKKDAAAKKDGARKWDAAKKDAAYKYDEAPKAAMKDAAYKYDEAPKVAAPSWDTAKKAEAPKAVGGGLAKLNAVADKICGLSDVMKRGTWLQDNQESFKSAMMEASASDPVASQEIMARIMGCLK